MSVYTPIRFVGRGPARSRRLASAVAVLGLAGAGVGCEPAPDEMGPPVPRASQRFAARNGMVAAAHPLAAEAGLEMLRKGGNAVDAGVATAFALGVVEPMMAGLGGGGSMTIWMAEERRADHVEFYASAKHEPDYALDEPQAIDSTTAPERFVGVPGSVAGLLAALERYGTLSPETVLAPAVELARDGFVVHALLAGVIAEAERKLTREPEAAAIFYPEGEPLQAGDLLTQPQLARALERIAREGRPGYYSGATAEALVQKLAAAGNPITLQDMLDYEPRWRRPVCGTYRGYTILSAPPPMAGVEVIETLGILDNFDLAALGEPYAEAAALEKVVDAIRLARADRDEWVGAPDSAAVPGAGLTSVAFASERAALVGSRVPDTLEAGDPWVEDRLSPNARCATFDPFPSTPFPRPTAPAEPGATGGDEAEGAETTHLSVVDRDRNAVSLTYTLGLYFGSGTFSEGAFYNTAALNFGGPESNRRSPGRPPRSSTAPTLVLEGEEVRLVVGSPASGRIPPAIVHTILYTLDFGYDPARAVAMPRLYPAYNSRRVDLEFGFSAEALAALRSRGYDLEVHPSHDMYFGGVHVVLARPDGWLIGAADPRREGAAVGY